MAKPGNAESFKVKMEDKGTHESNGNCMDKSDRVVITMLTSLQCDSAFGLPVADLQTLRALQQRPPQQMYSISL